MKRNRKLSSAQHDSKGANSNWHAASRWRFQLCAGALRGQFCLESRMYLKNMLAGSKCPQQASNKVRKIGQIRDRSVMDETPQRTFATFRNFFFCLCELLYFNDPAPYIYIYICSSFKGAGPGFPYAWVSISAF